MQLYPTSIAKGDGKIIIFYSGSCGMVTGGHLLAEPEIVLGDEATIMLSYQLIKFKRQDQHTRWKLITKKRNEHAGIEDDEIWKQVPGYDGWYEASTHGRVRSVDREVDCGNYTKNVDGKILKPRVSSKYGHVQVLLTDKDGNQKNWGVAPLILTTFVGPAPPGHEARHYPDQNPQNNRLDNLGWSSLEVNQADRVERGTTNRGSRSGMAKLNEEKVLKLRELWETGKYTKEQLGQMFGVSGTTAGLIIRRKIWEHI